MEICVRKMAPSDLGQAVHILEKWGMAPLSPSEEIPEPERSSINIENSFVAVLGNRVVGVASYIVLSDGLAETASLAVAPEIKGKGVGHLLQAARLKEMKTRGIILVRSETDRPETVKWYVENFGYRVVGTHAKKHTFSRPDIDHWTVLELDLRGWEVCAPPVHGEPS
jgi:predicted N-acetyltransferase YhbS